MIASAAVITRIYRQRRRAGGGYTEAGMAPFLDDLVLILAGFNCVLGCVEQFFSLAFMFPEQSAMGRLSKDFVSLRARARWNGC